MKLWKEQFYSTFHLIFLFHYETDYYSSCKFMSYVFWRLTDLPILLIGENGDIQRLRYSFHFSSTRRTISFLQVLFLIAAWLSTFFPINNVSFTWFEAAQPFHYFLKKSSYLSKSAFELCSRRESEKHHTLHKLLFPNVRVLKLSVYKIDKKYRLILIPL